MYDCCFPGNTRSRYWRRSSCSGRGRGYWEMTTSFPDQNYDAWIASAHVGVALLLRWTHYLQNITHFSFPFQLSVSSVSTCPPPDHNYCFHVSLVLNYLDALSTKEECVLQNGFQPSTRGQTYTFEIETDDFIQILHNGRGHWLTISTIGAKDDAEVCIYDSMYPSVSTIVKSQIAALLATKNKEIKMRFMDVQKQSGGYDCGVFAIAFATALAHGFNPGKYLFNQHVMWKHLLKCIEMANITMFPVLKTRRAEDRMKSEDAFEIYCTCRMPECPDVDMIQCCKCSEWFHVPFCVSVPRQAMDTTSTEWYCNDCE